MNRTDRPDEVIREAVALLKRGGVIAFPTETVYGIAADPKKKRAIARIYRLKGRRSEKAVAFQVDSIEKALRLVRANRRFEKCARFFWPGPLTLVARAKNQNRKIGIRVPDHAFVLKLLKAFDSPLAVTSANSAGRKELRVEKELLDFLCHKVDMILLQKIRRRAASTVVDLSAPEPVLLRKGPIALKEIRRAIDSP